MAETKIIPLSKIEPNKGQIEGLPKNPRLIKGDKFEKLKKSIQENPEMLNYRELLVYPFGKKYVLIGGNMRHAALKALGVTEAPCKVIEPTATVEQLRAYTIKDNSGFGEWDFTALADEWSQDKVAEWGVDIPAQQEAVVINEETEDEAIERKKREFEEKMAAGELDEDDPEYQAFIEKFEAKKTTDDCYTPEPVYEAVADWVAKEYKILRSNFVRPFYPGGDYKREKYERDDVVVDNPPFSIMSEILEYYNKKGIRYFLFGPHLTLFSSASSRCTTLPIGVQVTYANGAVVNTSFLTNLEPSNVRFRSEPRLYKAVKEANDANLKELHKEIPKYTYPKQVITTPILSQFSRYGIDFVATVDETYPISQLDSQKADKKAIFGKGYLISDRLLAEREKAEREKAEREKAEREKAEREKATVWELSDTERDIIAKLSKNTHK